jgi:hypothetical protein
MPRRDFVALIRDNIDFLHVDGVIEGLSERELMDLHGANMMIHTAFAVWKNADRLRPENQRLF